MKLQLGEILKKLRRHMDITQDELAEALDVSSQSVSRWEKGICYPDMELLPAIANYFEVTVDYLLGMDKIRSEEEISRIFTQVFEYERNGRYKEAISILRDAVKTYPNDDGILSELALALSKTNSAQDKKEAIVLSERVLEKCTNEKIRSTVRANLCYLYRDCGFYEKAEETARTLPHIWECREIHLREFVKENNKNIVSENCLNVIMQVVGDYVNDRPISFSLGYKAEEKINVRQLIEIFK